MKRIGLITWIHLHEVFWHCNHFLVFALLRCENRAKEIGIAYTDLNRLQQFQLTQYSDASSFSLTISYLKQNGFQCFMIYRMNPHIILFPTSQRGSRLYSCIERLANEIGFQLLVVARKYFDETEGQHLLLNLVVQSSQGTNCRWRTIALLLKRTLRSVIYL